MGMGKQNPIRVSCKYYRAWFKTVMRTIWNNNASPNCNWKFANGRLLEISNLENNVLSLYEEIQMLAHNL